MPINVNKLSFNILQYNYFNTEKKESRIPSTPRFASLSIHAHLVESGMTDAPITTSNILFFNYLSIQHLLKFDFYSDV